MAAPRGNTYWKLAKGWGVGNDAVYTPEELWSKACDYFDWVEKNPLKEQKVFGSGLRMNVSKIRAMTQKAFCIFAQISSTTFDNYHADQAYLGITTRIKDIIFTQKFEGAAADLLNTNIIAREIGLAEKTINENTNVNLNSDVVVSDEEAVKIKEALLRKY